LDKAIQACEADPYGSVRLPADAAYTAYVEAKTRWIAAVRGRSEMSISAYERFDKLVKLERKHGLHVRLLMTALKRSDVVTGGRGESKEQSE